MNPRSNLPVALSTFIGRQQEAAAVQSALAERRLVTLTGPGGSGKTRLALHVAQQTPLAFPDGVWLMEFARLQDAELVPELMAGVLGVREQSDRSLTDLLVEFLQPRSALLLLDNCEHLVAAIASLAAALLAAGPALKLLATSREPLGVAGEAVWPVPPLTLPARQPWDKPVPDAKRLLAYRQSEAVQLFVDRAQAVAPDFALTPSNAPWVADITRRLDGMPLAVELAAARVATLSTRQIAERLDDRFALLTSRLHTTPKRQQTLEATLDWSHELLTGSERILFRRLAVFVGQWSLAAAEAVGSGGDLHQRDVLDLLAGLRHKSLIVVAETDEERRYGYLETIRSYAAVKLAAAGEERHTQDRHLDYFVSWAEANAPNMLGPEQLRCINRFESEHSNIRAALDYGGADERTAERALRLAVACSVFWRIRGYNREGRAHLEALLAMPVNGAPTSLRAEALWHAAFLAYQQSDFAISQTLTEEALSIGLALGTEGRMVAARSFDLLGELLTEDGLAEEALPLLQRSLAIYSELGNERGVANMLMQLAWANMRAGNYEAAYDDMRESVVRMRRLGEPRRLAQALGGMGELAIRRGDLETAADLLVESTEQYRAVGDRWGTAASLGSLGWIALQQQQFDRMTAYLGESIALRMEIGESGGLAWCLEKLAEARWAGAGSLPATQQAVAVLSAAAALRAAKHSHIDPADQPTYERLRDELRQALGEDRFAAAWQDGASLPLSEAIRLALAPIEQPAGDDGSAGQQTAHDRYGGLSPRERETAVLIAQGKSNREVAAAMVVREKTIETYVTRILNKLGFDSRVQIATWVVQQDLLADEPDDA